MIWVSQRKKNTMGKIAHLQTHFVCNLYYSSLNNVCFGSSLPSIFRASWFCFMLQLSQPMFCLCKICSGHLAFFGITKLTSCVWRGGQGGHPFHSWRQANPKAVDKSFPRWQKDSLTIRNQLCVSPDFSPFTGHASFVGYGLPQTRRVRDLIDCFVISKMKELDKPFSSAQEVMSEMFIDVSQSHTRHAHTGSDGCQKCLTTATQYYSIGAGRIVLPLETLRWQGYPTTMRIPCHLTPNDLRDFSGEGMFLPSLATVLWCLYRIVDFSGGHVRELAMESTEEDSQVIASWA